MRNINMRSHLASLVSLVLFLGLVPGALAPSPGAAATIGVPVVTVTQLTHVAGPGYVTDTITIPGPGYTSSGFVATVATGDVVTVHIAAPPGKKFVVHAPTSGAPASFMINMYWLGAGGTVSSEEPHTLTFENLVGTPPSQTYSLVALGDQRQIVEVWKDYVYTASFEFTGILVAITAARVLPPVSLAFNNVQSSSVPSFGAGGSTAGPLIPIMEIVDNSTSAAPRSSWGRIKALYR